MIELEVLYSEEERERRARHAPKLRCHECGIDERGLVNAYGPQHGEPIEMTESGPECTDCRQRVSR